MHVSSKNFFSVPLQARSNLIFVRSLLQVQVKSGSPWPALVETCFVSQERFSEFWLEMPFKPPGRHDSILNSKKTFDKNSQSEPQAISIELAWVLCFYNIPSALQSSLHLGTLAKAGQFCSWACCNLPYTQSPGCAFHQCFYNLPSILQSSLHLGTLAEAGQFCSQASCNLPYTQSPGFAFHQFAFYMHGIPIYLSVCLYNLPSVLQSSLHLGNTLGSASSGQSSIQTIPY